MGVTMLSILVLLTQTATCTTPLYTSQYEDAIREAVHVYQPKYSAGPIQQRPKKFCAVLQFSVSDGKAHDVEIVVSSGSRKFDRASISAISKSCFVRHDYTQRLTWIYFSPSDS